MPDGQSILAEAESTSDARTGFRNRGKTQGKPQAVQASLTCHSHSADDLLAVEDLHFACTLQEVLADVPLQGNRDTPAAAQAGSVLFAPLTACTFRKLHLSNPAASTKSVPAVHTVSECHAVASHPSAAGVPPCKEQMRLCTEQVFPCMDQVRLGKEHVRSCTEQVLPCAEQVLPCTEQVLPCTEQVLPCTEQVLPRTEQVRPRTKDARLGVATVRPDTGAVRLNSAAARPSVEGVRLDSASACLGSASGYQRTWRVGRLNCLITLRQL
jgi:hypothetical protein